MADLLYINLAPATEREQFASKVKEVAAALRIEANWLMQVMYAESGLRPNAQNWQGSGKTLHLVAVGLIQFTAVVLNAWGVSMNQILALNRIDQMSYVLKFFKPYTGRIHSYYDLYAVTFFPAAVGKPDNWVLQAKGLSAGIIAKQNSRLDYNKDGQITVAEFKRYVKDSVPTRFQNIVFNGDKRYSSPSENVIGAETVQIDGIGDVVFEPDETYVTYPSTIPIETDWSNPQELAYSKESALIASSAINETYTPEESREIHNNLGPILKPNGFALELIIPFTIIRSLDFFGQRITVLPQLSSLFKNIIAKKTNLLNFAAENVLFPLREISSPITANTLMSIEEIKSELMQMNVIDPILHSISDKSDLIEKINEMGIIVFGKENPLEHLYDLEKEENLVLTESDFYDIDEVFSCPKGEIILPKFVGNEVESVANQCCEPIEISLTELEIPSIETPDLMSEEEILEFIDNVQSFTDNFSICCSNLAESLQSIEKVRKIKEDFYPLFFFMQKRQEFLESFKKGKFTDIFTFSGEQILSITKNVTSFSINTFLDNGIFSVFDEENSTRYTNQVGINNTKYFFLISDTSLYKEMKTLWEMYNPGGNLSELIQSSETITRNLKKTENARGILYREFYDKYNSINRVDFLFTAEEQGFLSEKPTVEEILTPGGEEKIKNLKIDEQTTISFLQEYMIIEEKRVEIKLEELKRIDYFKEIEKLAKKEAAIVYGLIKFISPLGQLEKKRMEKEHAAIFAFKEEIDKKIKKLQTDKEIAQQCIAKHQEALLSAFPIVDDTNIPSSGNDPFGAIPPSPFAPGITKNKYWKEYTKYLQTASFMPIPDVKDLKKRLFRYYPVGLRIPIPIPPKTLPTLASGIPDVNISIPFPIVWKHLYTLSTPAGQFVLWLTYCAPFTVSPYLMFIDENLNTVFLSTPKGKVDIPAKSLKWNDDSGLAKSLVDRIPGLKIPMASLPSVDNVISNKKPESKKNVVEELKGKIKAKLDQLDSAEDSFTKTRIQVRTTLKNHRDRLSISRDVKEMRNTLKDVKMMMKKNVEEMMNFEKFSVPKTSKKLLGSETINDFKNAINKVKELSSNGAKIDNKTIDIGKILEQKAFVLLETSEGRKIAKRLETSLNSLNNSSADVNQRANKIAKAVNMLIAKSLQSITPKDFGYVKVPINISSNFLPEPARSFIKIEPMPIWFSPAIAAIKNAANSLTSSVSKELEKNISLNLQFVGNSPSGKDLLSSAIKQGVKSILNSDTLRNIPIPGWPNQINFPSVNMIKQAVKNAANSIWKTKIRIPSGGIPAIDISSDTIKSIIMPVVEKSIDLIFDEIDNSLAVAEQSSGTSIKLQDTLQFMKTIFGTDIWDIREQDVKQASISFIRESLIRSNAKLEEIVEIVDNVEQKFDSIFKRIASFSKQKKKKEIGPSLDISGAVAAALFNSYTAKYVSGELSAPPYPVVLLGCATGIPGWSIFTKVDPFNAIDKLPPYERMSLKNVPFVIHLDMMIATAQRYGGIGCNYVAPYFTPDV